MVNVLTTLLKADGGTVRVAGHDIETEAKAVRAAIGVTGQFAAVDELLTGQESLQLMVDLNRVPGRRTVTELLERFDLVESAQKPVSTYSGGMRRKLDLAMTLVGNPRIIFLDEPTTGLDPRSRRPVAVRPPLDQPFTQPILPDGLSQRLSAGRVRGTSAGGASSPVPARVPGPPAVRRTPGRPPSA
jgi:ABC-type molybdate transport system ATPase subunit